jgi:hypothetical protein
MIRRLPLVAAIVLAACNPTPKTISGTVTDIWDAPVENATVQLSGAEAPATTGANGSFSFPRPAEAGTLSFSAEKEGYIQTSTEAELAEDAVDFSAGLQMYPIPEGMGFFAIGEESYIQISEVALKTIGTDVSAYTGLPSDPEAVIATQQFIFSSTTSISELARLNLEIYKMEFQANGTVTGITGEQEITLNLWTASDTVGFDITPLPREHFFLISPTEELPAGHYAFSTQNVLGNRSASAMGSLPVELQVAHPFQIKN